MAEISKAQERMEATLAEVKNAEEAITQLEVPEVLDLERSPKITGFIVFHCFSLFIRNFNAHLSMPEVYC